MSGNDAGGEVRLRGGRITQGVVRVGMTVRRPTGPHSAFVHELLRHLEAVGFDGAPRLLGLDDQGREVLCWVDGWVPENLGSWSDDQIGAAARLLRRFHDAGAGSRLAGAHEVVCHNDFSPCNAVFRDGMPVALIDFDAAAPGSREWDLAYAAWLWIVSSEGDATRLEEQARRVRLLVDAYGLPPSPGFVDVILARQDENVRSLDARLRDTDSRFARAARGWSERERDWLDAHAACFRDAMRLEQR